MRARGQLRGMQQHQKVACGMNEVSLNSPVGCECLFETGSFAFNSRKTPQIKSR